MTVGGLRNQIVSPDKMFDGESDADSYAHARSKLMPKKNYSVTTDEARHKFIGVWNSGNRTIKEVSTLIISTHRRPINQKSFSRCLKHFEK